MRVGFVGWDMALCADEPPDTPETRALRRMSRGGFVFSSDVNALKEFGWVVERMDPRTGITRMTAPSTQEWEITPDE